MIRTQTRILAVSVAAGLAAILLLGGMAEQGPALQQRREAVAVSAALRDKSLTDDNLPDLVSGLQLQQRLARIGWDHAILTVDLTLKGGETDDGPLWRDAVRLVRFAFEDVRNVKQLLLRVYRESGGRKTLLLYGDSRREDWRDGELSALRSPDEAGEAAFRAKLRMVLTPAGGVWQRNLANS